MVDFSIHYWVIVPAVGKCEVLLRERMEEVKEFKSMGTMLCKYGEMEGEVRDRIGKAHVS